MIRFFIIILIVFFLMIQFDIWFKDDGFYRVKELEQMIGSQVEENERLKNIQKKLGILCYDNFFHIFQKIFFARNLLTNVDKSVDVHQQKKRIKK